MTDALQRPPGWTNEEPEEGQWGLLCCAHDGVVQGYWMGHFKSGAWFYDESGGDQDHWSASFLVPWEVLMYFPVTWPGPLGYRLGEGP